MSKDAMRQAMPTVAAIVDEARRLFDYSPETGQLTRRIPTMGAKAWVTVGTKTSNGYLRVRVLGHEYLLHRLIWLHVHGEWPNGHIDHINGDKSDNRIKNLRDVSQAVNNQNVRKPKRTNQCGLLGASPHQGRWTAQLTVNRKRLYLGMFDTPEEAHSAYLDAKRKHHEGATL